ncbi:MAG TPA: sulfur carrier protein ThiS [Ignavibacteria bacterium]|jgi:sulfur carrier protein|nr:sulfur carrier protein ThiS [Ignavibacteria bacterium]
MNIKVNGELQSAKESITLLDFVTGRLDGKEPKGIAVALNETIIHREKWQDTIVKENDAIEIVHAVQGG